MSLVFRWPELPRALHERQPWGGAGLEPPLQEVLADPVIQAVMRSDGVDRAALDALVAHARWRLLPRRRSVQPEWLPKVRRETEYCSKCSAEYSSEKP